MTGQMETLFKWLFLFSLFLLGVGYVTRDRLPAPDFYGPEMLQDPVQGPTHGQPFLTEAQGQSYRVEPLFDYTLEGVVVSYNDADSLTDIWHHRKWQDYLNLRDLCVIWGENVRSGVYRQMSFSNDSWTCWASWPDATSGARFRMSQLSNNHLLTDDLRIERALASARPGDHVRFSGFLVNYANSANDFRRGSSTRRTDTGNGACETVYLRDFAVVKRANPGLRSLYTWAKWLTLFSLLGFLVMFVLAPVRRPRFR